MSEGTPEGINITEDMQAELDALQREYDDLSMVHHDMQQSWDISAAQFNNEIHALTTRILNATSELLRAQQELRMGSERDLDELTALIENAIKELAP